MRSDCLRDAVRHRAASAYPPRKIALPLPPFAPLDRRLPVAAANWFRYARLAHFSSPKAERQLYRLVKRDQICRIVEVGISDLSRAVAMIEIAQRFAGEKKVWYTGIDLFEAREPGSTPLPMKETYRILRATDANVRLVPGAPASSVAAAANAHQNTDLILIGPDVSETDLGGAWFYVPRMLNEKSTVLSERRTVDGQPTFTRLTRTQIAEWACQRAGGGTSGKRAA
jgi:hypothetical protein